MKGRFVGIGEEQTLAADFHDRPRLAGDFLPWNWNSTPGLPREVDNFTTIENLRYEGRHLGFSSTSHTSLFREMNIKELRAPLDRGLSADQLGDSLDRTCRPHSRAT